MTIRLRWMKYSFGAFCCVVVSFSVLILLRWGLQLKCCSLPLSQSFYSPAELVWNSITCTSDEWDKRGAEKATVVSCVCSIAWICAPHTFLTARRNCTLAYALLQMMDVPYWIATPITILRWFVGYFSSFLQCALSTVLRYHLPRNISKISNCRLDA